MQQRGEMHCRGCGGDAEPQMLKLLDDVRQGIRGARLTANASELRALNCKERVSPLANRTIAITV